MRLAGADRYLTAAEVARWSCGNGLSWSNVAVATGTGFADALAAAPTLGRSATPLLLASDAACSLIREKASAIDTCLLHGGTAAVSDAQERAVADALAGTSKGSSATTNTGGARTESDSGWYYSGSSHSRGKYAGEIYGPGYVEPQPQPQPQPEPEPADDDGYEGDTTPEAWGDFYLWPDEEDVLIPGGNVSAIVRTTSYERPNDPIYAQAEEADMPVARTEQTFYLEAPKGTVAPTLHVRNADGTERALGQMMPVSDLEVKALNDEYAGNTVEDTGDEYIVLLDPKAHSYWKYTLSPLPTDERTVAYVARTDTLVSNVTEVDYWLPFTTDEISVLEQVDAAIDAMQDDESYWQQSADRRKQTALALIESLAAKGLIEGDSWAFNEEDGVWTFIYNQDRNEDDADGIVGTIETQIVSEFDEYSDGGVDELMPYSEDLVAGEAAPDGIAAMAEPLVAQATTISRKKVLLLNAFPAFEKKVDERAERYAYYRKLATNWRKKGINVTLWERNITVDTFAHINTFDCVIIATHGARYKYWTGPRNNRKPAERSGYCVRQQRRDRAYAKALKDGQMVKAGNGYWILSKFFNARYKAGAFSSVVLGSESCSNFGRFGKIDTELPSAFIFKGATAAVGFHNTLASGYGRTFLTTFFEGMFEGKTVSSSMGAAMSKVGSTQKVWWARVVKKPYTYKLDCYPRFVGKQYGKLIS